MIVRAWLAAALGLTAACAARTAEAGPQACAPTSTGELPADVSAAALAGDYRLRLVATSGPSRGNAADAELHLLRADTGAAAEPARRFALIGTSDLDPQAVGGAPAEAGSTDPARPGVLGFRLPPQSAGGSPRVLLRLGAEANRQDVVRVEGAYTVLRVREITGSGFAGEWESGAPLPLAGGYFCASRLAGESR